MIHKSLRLFLFFLSVELLGCGGNSPENSTKNALGSVDSPQSPSSLPAVSDDQKTFDQIFQEYPWGLDKSSLAARFSYYGMKLNLNTTALGSYYAWIDLRTPRSADMKTKVEAYLKTNLANVLEILRTGVQSNLKIESVLLTRDSSELNIEKGVWILPRGATKDPDRILLFLSQAQKLKDYSLSEFNGIFVRPFGLGSVSENPSWDAELRVVKRFQSEVYPKVRVAISEQRAIVDFVEVGEFNDEVLPFEYLNRSQKLKVNLNNFSTSDLSNDLQRYLDLMLTLPTTIRDGISITSETNYLFLNIGKTLGYSYRASLEGLEAIKSLSSTIKNWSDIKSIRFVACLARSDASKVANYFCGGKDGSTLDLPVADRSPQPPGEVVRIHSSAEIQSKLLEWMKH